jgi:hypothetical protein
MLASMRRGHILRRWRHAVPEFVEIPVIKDDLCLSNLKILGIGILIGFALSHRGFGIEQDDNHIGISEDAADSWSLA